MKKYLSLILTLCMVLSMAACGADTQQSAVSEAEQSSAEEEYDISVILKTTAAEYYSYPIAGAEAYERDHPEVHVQIKGPASETSYDEQMNMIETDLNNTDIDAYVIMPCQSDMVATVISGQTKPIIALDTNITAPEVLSFVGTGNEAAAKLGGEAAVALAKERGWTEINCIEIAGVQGDATNGDRMAGYQAGVEAAGGTFLERETQYSNAEASQAVACMEAIMQTHPEGVAIICAHNDDVAMAAARTAAGSSAYENTVFLGFNGDQTACTAILNGELTMSVCQEPYEMAYMAVDSAVRALQGETLEAFVDTGASIVEPSTAQARLDMLKGYLA